MIEIKNKTRSPVQLVIKSKKAPKSFTTLNIPGIGAGNNIYFLEDERNTEYVERAEKMGLISIKHLTKRELNTKGE
jgi:hypothetical protein